ncbi:VCBS repeat-containing protein, partial [candidate division KSB1 bacterium]|nr:VCBS repeat-containing protein [candidate division KSB1 bacterium]
MDESGNFFTGELSISPVPEALAPAALPEELEPGLLVTIQPVGVTFDTPVPITFPNIDNLPPGSEVDIWSLAPETGGFIIVGIGQVTPDGQFIETISGGIRAADWHFPLPPSGKPDPSQNNPNNQDQKKCKHCNSGSQTAVSSGNLIEDHTLSSYRSSGQSRSLRFVYNSLHADPQPIINSNTTISVRAAVPRTISTNLRVAGVDQAVEVFTDTSGLSESVDETIRQAVQFDAANLDTGQYVYSLRLTSNYARSSISTNQVGKVLINNQQNSPFGAGWTLDGLQRLILQPNGDVLITEGDGSALVFTQATPGTGTFSGPTNFPVGNGPASVAVGDFDGDTILDLAVATVFPDRVSILLGDGSGGFSSPTFFPAGRRP